MVVLDSCKNFWKTHLYRGLAEKLLFKLLKTHPYRGLAEIFLNFAKRYGCTRLLLKLLKTHRYLGLAEKKFFDFVTDPC